MRKCNVVNYSMQEESDVEDQWQLVDIIYICSYVNNSDKDRLKWTTQRFLKEKDAEMYDDAERGYQHRPKLLYLKNYLLGSVYSSNYQSLSSGP